MKVYFEDFINLIKQKTTLDIVINKEGDITCDTDNIVLDEMKNQTIFSINVRGEIYTAKIPGADESAKIHALLIKELSDTYFSMEKELSKESFYKCLLYGELSKKALQNYAKKYKVVDGKRYVVLVECKNTASDMIPVLEGYANGDGDFALEIDSDMVAVIKTCDSAESEYKSSVEYADYLLKSVFEELGVKATAFVGSTVGTLSEINRSFEKAEQTKTYAEILGVDGGAHSFKEYTLMNVINQLPSHKIDEYVDVLTDGDVKTLFSDQEIVNTAEEFLENDLNVSETARKLFIHRNTLMYRIDKIEKLTGLNIRRFPDALTFRLMTILLKVAKTK